MANQESKQLLELIGRIQMTKKFGFPDKKTIRVYIGEKTIEDFPICHILLLPLQQSESILKNINTIKTLHFNYKNHNQFISQYYLEKQYEDIYNFSKETINVWRILNNDIFCDEPIFEVDKCIGRLEEKWDKEFYDFDQEINFIVENFDQVIKMRKEEFMKHIPFDLYNTILYSLPENRKMDWIVNIVPEGKKDLAKFKWIEAIGNLDIDRLNEDEFCHILEIISKESNGLKCIDKILKRFQHQKLNQDQEKMEYNTNQMHIEQITPENMAFMEMLNQGRKTLERERIERERIERERIEKERLEKERLNPQRKEEELAKRFASLAHTMSKEELLIEASKQGYLKEVKRLINEGVKMNVQDKKRNLIKIIEDDLRANSINMGLR